MCGGDVTASHPLPGLSLPTLWMLKAVIQKINKKIKKYHHFGYMLMDALVSHDVGMENTEKSPPPPHTQRVSRVSDRCL